MKGKNKKKENKKDKKTKDNKEPLAQDKDAKQKALMLGQADPKENLIDKNKPGKGDDKGKDKKDEKPKEKRKQVFTVWKSLMNGGRPLNKKAEEKVLKEGEKPPTKCQKCCSNIKFCLNIMSCCVFFLFLIAVIAVTPVLLDKYA